MLRFLSYLAATLLSVASAHAFDFGLRFLSHSFPTAARTTMTIDGEPFRFQKEFMLDFHFAFYDPSMFGNVVTIQTDDGKSVAIVASRLDDGMFHLGMVVNDSIVFPNTPPCIIQGQPEHVELRLDKEHNSAVMTFNESCIELPVDLKDSSSATFFFGQGQGAKQVEAAPFELRALRVFVDHRNTNHWDLKFHQTDTTSLDDLGRRTATVANPHWLIDDHADWKKIYTETIDDRIQTAFDPTSETIFIVGDRTVTEFDPLTLRKSEIPVVGGERVMAYSNHLVFDTVAHRLTNYNLNRRTVAYFDPASRRWISKATPNSNDEVNYSNHAVALDGNTLYAFGGYGFYKYHNDIFEIDLPSGTVREHIPTPELMPMTSSAAAVVDSIMYIFGGKGNASGRQELPVRHSYALYAYDTRTWKGGMVWELDSIAADFLPSQSMYYDREADSFYLASTEGGGQMVRIARTSPEWQVISTPILTQLDCYGIVFDLYRSADGRHYYLVVDKRTDNVTHDLSIYTISAPFLDDKTIIDHKAPLATRQPEVMESGRSRVWWGFAALLAIAALTTGAWWLRRSRKRGATTPDLTNESEDKGTTSAGTPVVEIIRPDVEIDAQDEEPVSPQQPDERKEEAAVRQEAQLSLFDEVASAEKPPRFNRDVASISLLGGFKISDRNGTDITDKFTTKLKSLLILLLLGGAKNENGIKYQLINEQIWDDKDEKSAQNNRNVTMRKLRILLQDVGNVAINYDKGYFKIETGDVMYDYGELRNRIKRAQSAEDVTPELVDEILELLLMGPLLPKTSYEWLDPYKAEFSDSAIGMLTRLLKHEYGNDDRLAFRIAETIALHDTLNEDAMTAKCCILTKRKMTGQARNVYDQFCREYLRSMGEEYPKTFTDICRSDI